MAEPKVLAEFEGSQPVFFMPVVVKVVTAYGELTAAELNAITRRRALAKQDRVA